MTTTEEARTPGQEPDISEFGRVVWHSSDEDSGPDVGVTIGFGQGRSLWFGEISQKMHEEEGTEAAKLGDHFGTWIILYDDNKPRGEQATVVGKAIPYVGTAVCDAIAASLKAASAAPRTDSAERTAGCSKWGPNFPPTTCNAFEDCASDGICHDFDQCQIKGPAEDEEDSPALATPRADSAEMMAGGVRTILARLWCQAEGNDPDDTISDAGHTVLDGTLGGLDKKAFVSIIEAERAILKAVTPPGGPRYQYREIGEGEGWRDCSRESYLAFAGDPHIDTRELPPAPSSPGVPDSVRALSEAATQGEWYTESEKCDGSYGFGEDCSEGYLAYSILTDAERPYGNPGVVAETSNSTLGVIHEESDEDGHTAWDETARANTAFIVAAVNYVRTLLSSHPAGQSTGQGADPVETVARALYEHDNRGLRDVWAWDADGLEEEHPGTRERYERQAAAALKAIGAEETEDDLDRRIARTGARENMQLIDSIADLIGLPHDVELQVSHVREAFAKPAPDSTRTGQVGTEEDGWRIVRAVMRRLSAAKNAGGIEDPETCAQVLGAAVDTGIVICREALAARPAAPEAQGAWSFDMEAALRDGSDVEIVNDRGQFIAQFDATWGDGGWWMIPDGKDPERPLRGNEPFAWRIPTKAPAPPSSGQGGC